MSAITYKIRNSLYLNITNQCTNECTFCIRYIQKLFNGKHPLWLKKEPTEDELLAEIGEPTQFKEIVFCGYGEPLIRLDLVKSLAQKLITARGAGDKPKIRVDTNGHANLYHKKDVLPELKGLVDEMQISLNAENAKKYAELCKPHFGTKAYPAILDFAREAKKYISTVLLTVVDLPSIDQEACRLISKQLDVGFRIRPYYEKKYKK